MVGSKDALFFSWETMHHYFLYNMDIMVTAGPEIQDCLIVRGGKKLLILLDQMVKSGSQTFIPSKLQDSFSVPLQ